MNSHVISTLPSGVKTLRETQKRLGSQLVLGHARKLKNKDLSDQFY